MTLPTASRPDSRAYGISSLLCPGIRVMKFYLIVAKGKHKGMPIEIKVDLFLIGSKKIQPLIIVGFNIDVPQVTRQIASSFNSALNNIVGGTFTAVVVTVERVTQFLLFLIVTFYLLLDAPHIGAYFARAIPRRSRRQRLSRIP